MHEKRLTQKKRDAKSQYYKEKPSLREKYYEWEEDVFENEIMLKFPNLVSSNELN